MSSENEPAANGTFGDLESPACQNVAQLMTDAHEYTSDVVTGELGWGKRHAMECELCQSRYPNAVEFLSIHLERFETDLVHEIEDIWSAHAHEAGLIARRAALLRPEYVYATFEDPEQRLGPRQDLPATISLDPSLALMLVLTKAGHTFKDVLARIYGEGLVEFKVILNADDEEEEAAWRECASVIRRLTPECREFVFSAGLAAELLHDLTWDPDAESPKGVELGVLYKLVQAAGSRYAEDYLIQNPPEDNALRSEGAMGSPITPERAEDIQVPVLNEERESSSVDLSNTGTLRQLVDAVQELSDKSGQELARAFGHLVDLITSQFAQLEKNRTDVAIDTIQEALGTQYHQLSEHSRQCLVTAEWAYTHSPAGMEFSHVTVMFMKAFEVEFLRTIDPIMTPLQEIVRQDRSRRYDPPFTLGKYLDLFNNNRPRVEPLLRTRGLDYDAVCKALAQVNRSRGAKHASQTTKSEATRYRTLFLNKPSILAALVSKR